MATSSSVIFRGPKKVGGNEAEMTFIEHVLPDSKIVFEIIAMDVTTQKELSRIYVDGDLVHQVVISEEKRKYAGTSSSETPEPMSPKILQNVSIQLLIDALSMVDTVIQLAPLSSEGNGDGTVVVLVNKPENIVPFDLTTYTTESSSSSSSSESQEVSTVMASLVQDASSLDSAGANVVNLSNQMSSLSDTLNMGFQQSIVASFDPETLANAVQDIIDDATIRRPRRGGPDANDMADLSKQYKKEGNGTATETVATGIATTN